MPIRRHYKPGSFLRVDDRTGFTYRAEDTRKEWTGIIVRDRSWEERHPQDFVRGVTDNQTVPEPRPLQTPVFLSNNTFALAEPADSYYLFGNAVLDSNGNIVTDSSGGNVSDNNSTVPFLYDSNGNQITDSSGVPLVDSTGVSALPNIRVNSVFGWLEGDQIQIMLDTGDYWSSQVIILEDVEVAYYPTVPTHASAGNTVINNSYLQRI